MIFEAILMIFHERISFTTTIVSLASGFATLTMDAVWGLLVGFLSISALITTIYKNYLEIKRIKGKK